MELRLRIRSEEGCAAGGGPHSRHRRRGAQGEVTPQRRIWTRRFARQFNKKLVSQVANQAAQQAAEVAAAHNLKHAVEEVVDRVISQREASSPTLGILASPDAAQQHLDNWKKDLEETAQSVRSRTIDETRASADAAKPAMEGRIRSCSCGRVAKTFRQNSEKFPRLCLRNPKVT